jgi:hypothetical protein
MKKKMMLQLHQSKITILSKQDVVAQLIHRRELLSLISQRMDQ